MKTVKLKILVGWVERYVLFTSYFQTDLLIFNATLLKQIQRNPTKRYPANPKILSPDKGDIGGYPDSDSIILTPITRPKISE